MADIQGLINFLGSQAELARILNVSEAAVSQWMDDGGLPARRAIQMERITHGNFKAVDLVVDSEKKDFRRQVA